MRQIAVHDSDVIRPDGRPLAEKPKSAPHDRLDRHGEEAHQEVSPEADARKEGLLRAATN